jgi:DNA end-binding protein Ku
MARAIWTGSISFGLVTIPVRLLPAVRADEEVHFHYLHAKDQGRLRNVRVCEVDGKEVPWNETVRGFEYEKGRYVVLDDEELRSLRPEATQAVEIQAFVARDEIDVMLFDAPYYLEPEKRGRRAYALLRAALAKSGKIGIAQVVLRTRAHLAALSPREDGLVLELLRYPHEVLPTSSLDLPAAQEKLNAGEMKAATMLIDAMTTSFDPRDYKDDYEAKLRAALKARAKGALIKTPRPKSAAASNVVDLAEVLKRSLASAPRKAGTKTRSTTAT